MVGRLERRAERRRHVHAPAHQLHQRSGSRCGRRHHPDQGRPRGIGHCGRRYRSLGRRCYDRGLGEGDKRPVFTFSTATGASIVFTGANSSLKNIVGSAGINALTNPFDVRAAGLDLDIEWVDTADNVEAVSVVVGTTAADRLNLRLKYRGRTGGSACVNPVKLNGTDRARIDLDFYGKASTAVVNFVTTACTDIDVRGYIYNSGDTTGAKLVVDTITGSTWYAYIDAGAAGQVFKGGSGAAIAGDPTIASVAAQLNVPAADAVTNVNERDVIGNKTDAAVTAVGTTKSILAFVKGLITMCTVQAADSANNAFAGDVVGNKTDAAAYFPTTTKSLAAYIKGNADLQEGVVTSATAVMVNGNTLFTVTGGWIQVISLVSECMTANGATASTLQYSATPTVGTATTFSGASASLANAAAGASVSLVGTALATAPTLNANGPGLGMTTNGGIIVPAGTITAVIGVGSTTGTWRHMLRYRPLNKGVSVA